MEGNIARRGSSRFLVIRHGSMLLLRIAIDGKSRGGGQAPSSVLSQQVKVKRSPLFKRQVGKIQSLPGVDKLKITLAKPAVLNAVVRFGLDVKIPEGFMIAIVTLRALKPMQSPCCSAP